MYIYVLIVMDNGVTQTILMEKGCIQMYCSHVEGLPWLLQEEKQCRTTRTSHNRVKKKKLSDSELQLQAVKMYLMNIGYTWPVHQKIHSRREMYV